MARWKPRLDIDVTTTLLPASRPAICRSRASRAMIWSPSTTVPGRVDRQHAVGVAVEREPEVEAAQHARRSASASRWVEPTRSLMLTPSGSQAVISCSMPSCAKTSGATVEAAPLAQSTSTRSVGHLDRRAAAAGDPGRIALARRRRAGATRPRRRRSAAARSSLHQRLDAVLFLVLELEPVRAEQLDAVVGEGVVRGRDDGAEARALLAHEPGDARRRQHAGAQRDAARRGDAGAQRVLEHRPRAARVAPDDDRPGGSAPRSRANSAAARPSARATSGFSTSPFATPRTPSVPNSRPATGGLSASRTAGGAVRP